MSNDEKPPVVLALDISVRRTGWAVMGPKLPRAYWGVYEDGGDWQKEGGKRLRAYRHWLKEKIAEHGVNTLAVETLIISPKEFTYDSHVPMAKLHGLTEEIVQENHLTGYRMRSESWRAHFLGTARAPKDKTKGERRHWFKNAAKEIAMDRGWLCEHDDEAEALGIADAVLASIDADYWHKVGPDVRRQELKAEVAAYRGDDLFQQRRTP